MQYVAAAPGPVEQLQQPADLRTPGIPTEAELQVQMARILAF